MANSNVNNVVALKNIKKAFAGYFALLDAWRIYNIFPTYFILLYFYANVPGQEGKIYHLPTLIYYHNYTFIIQGLIKRFHVFKVKGTNTRFFLFVSKIKPIRSY